MDRLLLIMEILSVVMKMKLDSAWLHKAVNVLKPSN